MSIDPMFGPPTAPRSAFCIEVSSSTKSLLPVIRNHLKTSVSALAGMPGARFNVITIGESGKEGRLGIWSDRLTVASPDMLKAAHEWIDAIRAPKAIDEESDDEAEEKHQTLDGDSLLEAIQFLSSDSTVQAIHLVAGSAPNCDQESLLDQLVESADGIAIHCVYLCEMRPRRRIFNFFLDLAEDSGGTMRGFVADNDNSGNNLCMIERSPTDRGLVWKKGRKYERLDEPRCSVATALSSDDPVEESRRALKLGFSWYNWWHYPRLLHFRPTKQVMAIGEKYRKDRLLMTHNSEEAGDALVGHHVLARRARRGVFYRGIIQKKVGLHDFLVTFSSHEPTTAKDFETVHLSDIIDLDDGLRTSVAAGDCVLAPRGLAETAAYEPADVICGFEKRDAYSPSEDSQIIVTFSDGETSPLEPRKAVWIPLGLHTRFVLELDMNAADRGRRRQQANEIPSTYYHSTDNTIYASCDGTPQLTWSHWYHPFFPHIGSRWNLPMFPYGIPSQPLDLRTFSQPIHPSVGHTTHLRDVAISINDSSANIQKAASEEESHPYEEKGPFINGFRDDGHPVALSRPPLREIHRKPPWRYWGRKEIPNIDSPPSFEPYKDPENMWGKPFAMTSDLNPCPSKLEESVPTPPSKLRVPEPTTPSKNMVGRIARDLSRADRIQAVLHRADLAAALRDDSGLSRVRSDRRERLIRRQLGDINSWAFGRREMSPNQGKKEHWSHDSWDWIDRKLITEERHSEMARKQFQRRLLPT